MSPAETKAQSRFIVEYADDIPNVAQRSQQSQKKPSRSRYVPKSSGKFFISEYVELDRPLRFGEHFWDESHASASVQSRPAQIVVDLEAEQLYVYRAGVEVARTKITRGWEQYDTPTGIFPILEKDADHFSSTYDNAPMPYNLRLTWKGVAIHGADVDDVSATHGCIGVPLEFARKLFSNVRKGDKVFVTRNWQRDIYG